MTGWAVIRQRAMALLLPVSMLAAIPLTALPNTALAQGIKIPNFSDPTKLISFDRPSWGNSRAGQYLAGRSAERQLDYGTAANYFEHALGQDPDYITLRNHVFFLLIAEGRLADARQHARALVRRRSNAYLPNLVLAVLDMQNGQHDAARERLAVLNNSGHIGLMRQLGQAWASSGVGDVAAAKAIMAFPSKAPGWDELLALNTALMIDVGGGDATAAYDIVKADTKPKSGRLITLLENYDARQKDPSVAPIIKSANEGMAQSFATIASALGTGKQAQSSLIYAHLGLNLSPTAPALLLLVAEALQDQERHIESAAFFDRIGNESRFHYPAQIARARNLAAAEMTDEAIAALEAVAAANPARPEASSQLGDILRREQRFADAAMAYDEALTRAANGMGKNWRLLYTRGIALERLGRWAEAEADFTEALALEKDHPLVLNYLGYSWVDRGENLEKAKDMVRLAAKLRPEDGFIADSVGWAAYRTGDFIEAIAEMERAILLEPTDPVINEHLGDVYWVVGRKIEARYQWERALGFKPEEDRLPGLEERLRCGLDPCDGRTPGAASAAKDGTRGAQ